MKYLLTNIIPPKNKENLSVLMYFISQLLDILHCLFLITMQLQGVCKKMCPF